MAKQLSKGTSEKWQDPESNVSSCIPESATFTPSTIVGAPWLPQDVQGCHGRKTGLSELSRME